MNNRTTQQGLTLVEILVALVISLFLLGGIVQVYFGNQVAFRFGDAAARIQENGRFAIDTLTRDLRLAGFFGCVNFTVNDDLVQNHLTQDASSDTYDFLGQRPVVLVDDGGLNDSDDIIIKGSTGGHADVLDTLSLPGSGAIRVDDSLEFENGDIVLITNCWTSDIFQATQAGLSGGTVTITHTTAANQSPGNDNINDCPGNSHCLNGGMPPHLETEYTDNNASVYKLQSVQYTVDTSTSGSGEPALWRNVNEQAFELVEGVEQMTFMYGIDTDSDGAPNQYVNSATVLTDDQTVVAVRAWIVVRSDEDNILDAAQTYVVNGTSITANDRRMRQVFSVTVDLRNR